MKESTRKTIFRVMLLLSVIGLGVTSYQTYEHYFLTSSVCDFTAAFSCSVVTESRFGEFPHNSGIATAAWGILWWGGLTLLIYNGLRKKTWFRNQEFYIFVWLLTGLVFVFYLLAVELYILPQETGEIVICPLCTVQHILIVTLLITSFFMLRKSLGTYFGNIFYVEK